MLFKAWWDGKEIWSKANPNIMEITDDDDDTFAGDMIPSRDEKEDVYSNDELLVKHCS